MKTVYAFQATRKSRFGLGSSHILRLYVENTGLQHQDGITQVSAIKQDCLNNDKGNDIHYRHAARTLPQSRDW
jgi:hypothetical protein